MAFSLSAVTANEPLGPLHVEGTTWEINEQEGWTQEDINTLKDLASVLPDRLKNQRFGPYISNGNHQVGRADLHSIRSTGRGRKIEVIGGVGSYDKTEFQRKMVHALVHSANEEHHWTRKKEWLSISEWGFQLFPPGEGSLLAFANEAAKKSPIEDLATFAESAYLPTAGSDWEESNPVCRLRSQRRFLTDYVGPITYEDQCPSLKKVGLEPSAVEGIDVVFVEPTGSAGASLGGHLAFGVSFKNQSTGRSKYVVYQMAAAPSHLGPGNIFYGLFGVFGGFNSIVFQEPFLRTVMRYDEQARTVTRYRLELSYEEKIRILERLDDVRQFWHRRYLFFTRNCSILPKDIIEWGLKIDLGVGKIYTPDVFLGKLDRLGRINRVLQTNIAEFPSLEVVRKVQELRNEAAAELISSATIKQADLRALFNARWSYDPMERSQAYRDIAQFFGENRFDEEEFYNSYLSYFTYSEIVEKISQEQQNPRDNKEINDGLWLGFSKIDFGRADRSRLGPIEIVNLALLSNSDFEDGVNITSTFTHAPWRAVELGFDFSQNGNNGPLAVRLSTALYATNIGERRKYAIAKGVGIQVFETTVSQYGSRAFPELSDFSLIRFQRIRGQKPFLNPGTYLVLLGLNKVRQEKVLSEFGALTELVQSDWHRFHIAVSGGARLGLRVGDDSSTKLGDVFLNFPLAVLARVSASKFPMTFLSFKAETEVYELNNSELRYPVIANLSGGLYFGEIMGVAAAGQISFEHSSTDFLKENQKSGVFFGIRFEPN